MLLCGSSVLNRTYFFCVDYVFFESLQLCLMLWMCLLQSCGCGCEMLNLPVRAAFDDCMQSFTKLVLLQHARVFDIYVDGKERATLMTLGVRCETDLK